MHPIPHESTSRRPPEPRPADEAFFANDRASLLPAAREARPLAGLCDDLPTEAG